MEQIILYLAILAALSGFGMGLMNLAGPWLKRSNISLPSLSIASDIRVRIATLRSRVRGTEDGDDEFDPDDEDDLDAARGFAENSFAPDSSLLAPRRRTAIDEEELDEELAGVLDEVAEEDLDSEEDAEQDGDDDEGSVFTVAGTASDEAEDASEAEDADEDELLGAVNADEDEEDELLGALNVAGEDAAVDDDEDDEDDDGEEDDEDEADEEEPEADIQVVAGGGGDKDDMLSFFNEASDAGAAALAAWREDLPEVTIQELLADAQEISAQIHGKKPDAA